jgi:transcriptional regulator with XRE-family HTH domain
MDTHTIHEGSNLRGIREIMGVKQEALAHKLGNGWNQQKISLLEGKEVIDPKILNEVASALGVSPDAIRNYNKLAAINIVSNNFTDFKDNAIASAMNYQCTFNPIEKILKLQEEKEALLERIISEKKAQIAFLQSELAKQNKK